MHEEAIERGVVIAVRNASALTKSGGPAGIRVRLTVLGGPPVKSRFSSLLLVFCLVATTLLAQVVITSTVVGNVTDPQGAIVPGAAFALINVDTGVQRKGSSNNAGDFQFSNLNAGHYRVEVEKQGFAKGVSTPIALENGTTQRVNFALQVGKTEEVVEVSSAAE